MNPDFLSPFRKARRTQQAVRRGLHGFRLDWFFAVLAMNVRTVATRESGAVQVSRDFRPIARNCRPSCFVFPFHTSDHSETGAGCSSSPIADVAHSREQKASTVGPDSQTAAVQTTAQASGSGASSFGFQTGRPHSIHRASKTARTFTNVPIASPYARAREACATCAFQSSSLICANADQIESESAAPQSRQRNKDEVCSRNFPAENSFLRPTLTTTRAGSLHAWQRMIWRSCGLQSVALIIGVIASPFR